MGSETCFDTEGADDDYQLCRDGSGRREDASVLQGRLHEHFSEPQIVEAAYVITQYIAISKFGDALGVELEPVFDGLKPILAVEHGA